MRVLLVHPHLFHHPTPSPPVGLAHVGGALRALGAHVAILDLGFVWNRTARIPEAVRAVRPDVVGVGIAHLDNACAHHSLSFLPQLRWIVDRLRRATAAPVVAGGAGFGLAPVDLLTYLGLGAGLTGRDPWAAARLLLDVGAGRDGSGIPGAFVWDGARYARAVEQRADDAQPPSGWLARAAPPAHDLVSYRPYLRRGGAVAVPVQEAGGARAERPRPAEAIVDEVLGLHATQEVERFLFAGLLVGSPPHGDGDRLLASLATRPRRIRFEAEARPGALDRDRAQRLRDAGCVGLRVAWGGEDETTLRTAVAAARGAEVPVVVETTVAAEGETAATLDARLATLTSAAAGARRVLLHVGARCFDSQGRPPPGSARGSTSVAWPRFSLPDAELLPDALERVRAAAVRRPHWLVAANAYSPWYRVALGLERRAAPWPPWRAGSWLGWPGHARRALRALAIGTPGVNNPVDCCTGTADERTADGRLRRRDHA